MKETFVITGQVFTANIHKEGKNWVANCVEVPVSDFGSSKSAALRNLAETTREHLLAFPMDNPMFNVLNIKKCIAPFRGIPDHCAALSGIKIAYCRCGSPVVSC